MGKIKAKILPFALALVMVFALGACARQSAEETPGTGPEEENGDTLVVGYDSFSQKFSPFFSVSAYDEDAAFMTQVPLMDLDREGNPLLDGIEGDTAAYNGTDYTYTGISDINVVRNADGSADYNIAIRDDIVFSDGVPMTIDDVIFSMYVLSDPTYDGIYTFYALPIEGMEAYRDSMAPLYDLILAAGPDNTDFSLWTEAQQDEYWAAFSAGGEKFAQEIVDYCAENVGGAENYYGSDVALAMVSWGLGSVGDDGVLTGSSSGDTFDLAAGALPGVADLWNEIVAAHGYDLSDDGINYETAGTNITAFINDALGGDADAFNAAVAVGDAVPSIIGIRKTGDYTMTVHTTGFETSTLYQLSIPVAPMHYYGDASLYDYDNNTFGFPKGDLSLVRAKTAAPLGAGPYRFVSYENGVITYEANARYWKGCPKTKYVLFQETADGDKVPGIVSGSLDIASPNFSSEVADAVRSANSNGELTGDVVTTATADSLGYGYIGISADNVNVGGDASSFESKCLRKAFATLFAVFRDTVIRSYFGDLACVIEYPISNTSWAAPRPSDEGYRTAYSVDADGNSIYAEGMTEQARFDAALQAAVGYLKAAGYTWDEAAGKFTAAPSGARMAYEVIVPGDGEGNHPVYGIMTAAKEALASVGITLEINDPSDYNDMLAALDGGTAEMWCAGWDVDADPDMYQIYHSSNARGGGGTDTNYYGIRDSVLDGLIMDARASADQSFRKAAYRQCLDIILDWAVEVPCYQRQDAYLFSTERIDVSTVTPGITTFWGWMQGIENIRMK